MKNMERRIAVAVLFAAVFTDAALANLVVLGRSRDFAAGGQNGSVCVYGEF
jgi:hypothetical protein